MERDPQRRIAVDQHGRIVLSDRELVDLEALFAQSSAGAGTNQQCSNMQDCNATTNNYCTNYNACLGRNGLCRGMEF